MTLATWITVSILTGRRESLSFLGVLIDAEVLMVSILLAGAPAALLFLIRGILLKEHLSGHTGFTAWRCE